MTNRTKPRRSDTSSRETEGNKVELSTCTDGSLDVRRDIACLVASVYNMKGRITGWSLKVQLQLESKLCHEAFPQIGVVFFSILDPLLAFSLTLSMNFVVNTSKK